MSISTIQNFYKETITRACTLTGATNIYVSALPTPAEGYVVISPSSSSLREIVYYTAKGTDSNGTYLTVTLANRGLGGTTAQTHAIGEPVRMNVTAEHIKEISDALDQIVAGGTQDASTTSKGISKLSVAPVSATNPIAVGTNDPRVPTADPTTLFFSGMFGDGSDGDVTISSPTTLTRDMYYDNLIVNSTLTTDGFMIFCKTSISGNGTVKFPDGGAGGTGADGGTGAGTGGAGGATTVAGRLKCISGGAGGTQTGGFGNSHKESGFAGGNGYVGIAGKAGGAGGASGYGAGGGGAGGINKASFKVGIYADLTLKALEIDNTTLVNAFYSTPSAGGGGTGGNGNNGNNSGGGGGGGGGNGGVAIVIYGTKTWTGSYNLTGGAKGVGVSGTYTSGGMGGGGGGGGASGGVVFIATKSFGGSFTITAIGGAGGNGGKAGIDGNKGVDGTAGETGTSYEIPILTLTR